MVSLSLISLMMIIVISQELGWQNITLEGAPGAWRQVEKQIISHLPALRWAALALSFSLLYSLGSTVQLTKRSWILTEAVRRHLPTSILSDTLLSGHDVPAERRTLTIMYGEILDFNSIVPTLSADDLVYWLNYYYAEMCNICEKESGSLIALSGKTLMFAFGLNTGGPDASQALKCALSMYDHNPSLNAALVTRGLPPVKSAFVVHCGVTVIGDLGSSNRRQFAIVGHTVDVATRMLGALENLPEQTVPVVFSREVALEAGLLSVGELEGALVEFSIPSLESHDSMFVIRTERVPTVREQLALIDQRRTKKRANEL